MLLIRASYLPIYPGYPKRFSIRSRLSSGPSCLWMPSRTMADVKDSIPHVERTAGDRRQAGFYNANVGAIEVVNKRIRLVRLSLEKDGPPLRHLPGQYIDLHIPGVPVVGGFTITSPPQTALTHRVGPTTTTTSSSSPAPPHGPVKFTNSEEAAGSSSSEHLPFIELAVQQADSNPPAAYLWQDPPSAILHRPVSVRVGGNFTYPPATLSREDFQQIQNVVFVAGGVGINPIMSMVSAMDLLGTTKLGGMVRRVRVLYSSKRGNTNTTTSSGPRDEKILFEGRLKEIATRYENSEDVDLKIKFFKTSGGSRSGTGSRSNNTSRRIGRNDLMEAVGEDKEIRKKTLVYICGVPSMTDEFVDLLRATDGLDEKRVLCEKWW